MQLIRHAPASNESDSDNLPGVHVHHNLFNPPRGSRQREILKVFVTNVSKPMKFETGHLIDRTSDAGYIAGQLAHAIHNQSNDKCMDAPKKVPPLFAALKVPPYPPQPQPRNHRSAGDEQRTFPERHLPNSCAGEQTAIVELHWKPRLPQRKIHMCDLSGWIDEETVAVFSQIPMQKGLRFHHRLQFVPIRQQMSSFVARVVTRKKVYLSRSRWPEPGTIANEQIRPTHGAFRIRIPDRWTNCSPWAAMGSNEVFCPLGVWETVILRQRDEGCRATANASRVGSPDGVNCPHFHNLNLRKLLQEIGQRGLTQLQLRARGGHNHNFERGPERLTGKVRNRVTDTVKTVGRRNHNR